MLCANVATAAFFEKLGLPTLYRVHEGPSEERLENLRAFLGELGLGLRGGKEPTPRDYQALLEEIAERPDANVIQTMLLRSLRQAVYQPENKGHFGLNYEGYAHFTSPIRRYPDLLVHRGIRCVLRSKMRTRLVRRADGARRLDPARSYPYDEAAIAALGEHCSTTERRADDATRDVDAWLKCEYLQDHVGETFAGVVSAVTSFGLFVQLADLYIEGLVHVTALPGDYYRFDPAHARLVGERSGRTFQLGDDVTVQVARVDLDDKKIDLELQEAPARRKDRSRAGKGRGAKPAGGSRARAGKGDAAARAAERAEAPQASAGAANKTPSKKAKTKAKAAAGEAPRRRGSSRSRRRRS